MIHNLKKLKIEMLVVLEICRYMAASLLRVASEHSSVVAVIGRGHIDGIKKNWKQPITVCCCCETISEFEGALLDCVIYFI